MGVVSRLENVIPRFDRQVWSLFGAIIIGTMGSTLVMTFMSIYMYENLGMTMTQVGLADFLTTIVGAVAAYAGGALCDVYGRKKLLVAGLVLQIFSYLLVSLSIDLRASIPLFILALAFNQFNGSLYRGIPDVMVADVVGPGSRTKAYGLLRIGANLGWVIGPSIGGIFLVYATYSSLFYVTAFTTFTYLLIALFILRDTKPQAAAERFRLSDIVVVGRDRAFLLFCLLLLAMTIPYQQMYTLLSVYASAYVGLDKFWVGALFSVSGIMVALLQYYISHRVSRFRMTSALAFAALVFSLGFGMLSLSTAFFMPFIGIVVITFGEMVWAPASSTLQANLAPENMRGRYFGFSGLMNSIGWAVGPLFGGLLKDSMNNDVPLMWAVVGALFLFSLVGFALLGRVIPASANGSAAKAATPENMINA